MLNDVLFITQSGSGNTRYNFNVRAKYRGEDVNINNRSITPNNLATGVLRVFVPFYFPDPKTIAYEAVAWDGTGVTTVTAEVVKAGKVWLFLVRHRGQLKSLLMFIICQATPLLIDQP